LGASALSCSPLASSPASSPSAVARGGAADVRVVVTQVGLVIVVVDVDDHVDTAAVVVVHVDTVIIVIADDHVDTAAVVVVHVDATFVVVNHVDPVGLSRSLRK